MKPCPFCGAIEPTVLQESVACMCCGARGPRAIGNSDAAAKWNDRSRFGNSIHSTLIEQIREVRDLLTDLIGDDDREFLEFSRDD